MDKHNKPSQIFEEFQTGTRFKSGLGTRGIYDQSKMNERYFIGDQWYGVNCGNERPLVRHNVIKRIGDYKMAVIGASPVAVNYSADGVANTVALKELIQPIREGLASTDADIREQSMTLLNGMQNESIPEETEISLVMSAMSDYFRVTAERVKFEDIREQALRNAYISGTGVIYSYWDDRVRTGMYADENRKQPIKGDIGVEVLDIENVYFGDPNLDGIQDQPYILVAQRKSVSELRREAKRNRRPAYEIEQIKDDSDTGYEAGQMSEDEPAESKKATVITKFWKEWDEDGNDYVLKAIKVCKGAVIRPEWDIGIRLYPFAKFTWERRRNCAYGESEITYLIPNQIAINRMITASVWAVMMMGMPIMVVNGDVVTQEITNDPGQVIYTNGGYEGVNKPIGYVNPPNFSPALGNNVDSLINNTLTQSGANDAALGDIKPDNAAAIIAVREASTMPLQTVQNRYYSFCEDLARIWAEFWVMKYGKRSLKVEDDTGTWYMPFDGNRYKDFLISTKIDVGASTLWSVSQSISTLDNLFDRQVIDVVQYLQRLPKGTVPGINKLVAELKQANAAAAEQAQAQQAQPMPQESLNPEDVVSSLPPELQQVFSQLDPAQAQAALDSAMGAV